MTVLNSLRPLIMLDYRTTYDDVSWLTWALWITHLIDVEYNHP